jgi:putative resolvase
MAYKKKYFRIQEAAGLIGVTEQTVRNYCNTGRLNSTRNPANQRVFNMKDINSFLGKTEDITAFYIRSSNGSEQALQTQTELLTHEYGNPIEVFKDKASGLNEKRPGLEKLIKKARSGSFTRLAVTNKDRLSRFGFTYLERHLEDLGITIVLLEDSSQKTLQDELMADFMSLLASFSGKFYKMRGLEQKKRLLTKASEQLDIPH